MAYATVDDLTAYLGGEAVPDNAAVLLDRASRLIDVLLIGAVYDTDDDHMPIRTHTINALRDATCAQVQWFDETGDSTGAAELYQSQSIGSVSFTRGYTGSGSATGAAQRYAPDAVNILRLAALTPASPWMYG